jgi:hypothetical protein
MAQAGYTPIKLYYSATAAAVPLVANMVDGELAINTNDGKLYYRTSGGAVALIASNNPSFTLDYLSTTQGSILYRSATAWVALAPGTSGYILQTNGAGANPSWVVNSGGGGSVASFSAGSTGFTPNTATTGAVTLAGTLGAGYGGTGLSTFAIGDMMYASATTPTISKLTIGTANQILNVNTGATAPQWTGLSSLIDTVFTASAQGTVLYRGASGWAALAPGTSGYVLTTSGAGANPSWAVGGGGGGVTSISFGSTGLTPSTASTGAVSVAGTLGTGYGGTGLTSFTLNGAVYASSTSVLTTGTLPVASGGTSIATYTQGDTLYASATNTLAKLAIGTAYQIKAVNAAGTLPSWQGLSSLIDNALSAATQGQILYRNATSWVALNAGTAGEVLTTGGGGANPAWAAAAAGLTGFTAAQNTAAPNATIYVDSLTATAGVASADIALVPKGVGGLMLAIPDALAAGGNKRGNYAIDFQLVRSAATMVASSNNSMILGGQNNTASTSTYATIINGDSNTASGQYSLVHGSNSTANSAHGAAFGAWATTRSIVGYKAFAPNAPIASALGNSQMGVLSVGVQTTDATATVLRSNTSAAAATNQLAVAANSIVMFEIIVAAGLTAAGNAKVWEIKGGVKRGTLASTTALIGANTTNVIASDSGASAWTVAVTADTTNGCVAITVTGQAATTIRWNASIITSEVTY